MDIELQINNSADWRARYVTWAPSPCKIRLTDTTGLTHAPAVTLSSKSSDTGGSILFRTSPTASPAVELTLTLPLNGSSVEFFVAGEFGKPSLADGDVTIQVRSGTGLIAEVPIMVRIRKDAATLSDEERNRFIAAFAKFNNRGTGRFTDFRNMHTAAGSPEAHGQPGFLPWHRAYLLDLERELQNIDPSVALPYWRFDRPAPGLFTRDFLGESGGLGTVRFSSSNPLQFWVTDGVQGIVRRPLSTRKPKAPSTFCLKTKQSGWAMRLSILRKWKAIRTDRRMCLSEARSRAFPPLRKTRCFLCFMPTWTGYGLNGRLSSAGLTPSRENRSIRTRREAETVSAITCPIACGRGTELRHRHAHPPRRAADLLIRFVQPCPVPVPPCVTASTTGGK